MSIAITSGADHIGLTVSKLEESADFFTSVLGWKEVARRDDYPAIFVSDGNITLTLWSTKEEPIVGFDKNKNVGLHHVAFRVDSEAGLNEVYEKLLSHDVEIEFSPELVGDGPAKHMFFYEPSGIRVELKWSGV